MRSKKMTGGLEKAPHRSLLQAMGLTRREMDRPLIGVCNAFNEVIPGHVHLRQLTQAVKDGVRSAGGTPMEFPARWTLSTWTAARNSANHRAWFSMV